MNIQSKTIDTFKKGSSKMSRIIKFKRKEKYTRVSNSTLQNEALTFGARGILSYILSLPENWELRISDLYNRSPQGRTAIDSLISELKVAGHLLKITYKTNDGRFKGCDWIAFDEAETLDEIREFLKNIDVEDNVVTAHVEYSGATINVSFSPDVDFPTIGIPVVGITSAIKKTYTKKTITKETSSSTKKNAKLEEDLFLNLDIKPITKTNIKKFISKNKKPLTNRELLSMAEALKKANNFDDFDKAFYMLVKGEWEITESRSKGFSSKLKLQDIYDQAKELIKSQGLDKALEFYKATCKANDHDYSSGTQGACFLKNLKLSPVVQENDSAPIETQAAITEMPETPELLEKARALYLKETNTIAFTAIHERSFKMVKGAFLQRAAQENFL